jgi:lactate dehydrogenase-like 2-hydroxyacid dehydrogenase
MTDKPDLLVTSPMMPLILEGLAPAFTVHRLDLAADPDALIDRVAGTCRFVVTGAHAHIDDAFMARLPKLEIVANMGVGYDTVDAAAAARRGIIVTNTPDVLTEDVADLALGLLLATVRELPQSDRFLRAGHWLNGQYPLTKATLRGRRMGIVGLGRIGKAIARRAEAFGLPISYFGRRRQDDVAYPFFDDLEAMARAVDILMVVIPGGPATRNLIDARVLAALGPDGILINVARGSVVDEEALIEALRKRVIYSAGLDVFADEPHVPQALIDMDHVVLLPHVGSATVHTRAGMGQLVVDNALSWKAGKGPVTPVAETPWPRAHQA